MKRPGGTSGERAGEMSKDTGALTSRVASLAYGVVAYLIFLATFLDANGSVGDLLVPKPC